MDTNLNRRAFIAAASASSVAVATPALAISSPAFSADRSAWNEAMLAHKHAVAEDAAFDPLYWKIHRSWEAGRPTMDTIHWGEFEFADRDRTARTLDLDEDWQRFLSGEGKWWNAHDPEARKARYRAALDSVQAFRDAEARQGRDSGMTQADERWEALGDGVHEIRQALMNLPAPDLAALRWKLAQFADDDGDLVGWTADFVRQTFVDIARLLPGEA